MGALWEMSSERGQVGQKYVSLGLIRLKAEL